MKKITVMAFLLALLAPIMSAWGASYTSTITAEANPSAGGTVFVNTSKSDSGATYAATSSKSSTQSETSVLFWTLPASFSFYLYARPASGYYFAGWSETTSGSVTSSDNPYIYSFQNESRTKTFYAKFEQDATYDLTLVKPVGVDSYTVTGQTGFDGSGLSAGGTTSVYKSGSYTFKVTVADGYEFVKWTVNGTDAGTSTTLTKSFTSDVTVEAVVNKLETYYATCLPAPAGCSYKVGSTVVSSSEYKTSGYGTLTVNLSAPTAASGYVFSGWYTLKNGVKTIISTENSTTITQKADVTLGADFVAITAPVMLVTSSGIVDYDDFDAAFAAAKSGDKLKVVGSGTLSSTAEVAAGVTLEVASGVTLTVADGATLYIDGNATVNGTIAGTVSKCTKLIQQTGDGTVNKETEKPNPFTPYDGVKYWRTTTITPSISVSSSVSHITVVNGYGNVFRTSATTAKALVCTVDMSTAVNHITSIDTDYTSFTLAYESARQSDTAGSGTSQSIKGNSKLIVMLANDTSASESGDQRYGFMVDCAGCNLAFTATLKSNYDVVILNCPYTEGNQLKSTITNTRVHFFNCKKAGVKINSQNSTIVNCYDCGDLSISYDPTTVKSGEVNIYSGGTYSASFNKLWHVYGGTFAKDPSSYLWDSVNYEVEPDGSNFKVVEKKKTVDVAYTISGGVTTKYQSLTEAISKVANGGTVYLMQDIELDADIAIGAGRDVTLELQGGDISGHSIVNAGTLHLEDSKMTSNPGTVSSSIVNDGTITIAYGIYTGSVQLNDGKFTVYNGTVDGNITVASTVEDPATVANLKGGQFASRSFSHGSETKDISTICEVEESEHVVKEQGGRFRVARFPAAIVTDTGTMSLSAVALDSTTDAPLWTRFAKAPTRANFTATEWYRACELQSTFEYYQTQGIDCAVLVDRTVDAGTLSISAPVIGTQPINAEILVSEFGYSALLPMIRDFPHTPRYAPWAYSTFLPGGEHSSVSIELSNGNVANNGTLLILQMRLASNIQATSGKQDYSYTQYEVIGFRKYVLNAGSNLAMIRPATGAATFYATLGAAMNAAADGGTVMLANDCTEGLALNKAGTYTFDTMGFAYSGGEPAVGSGLRIASVTTNAVDSSAKVLVPEAMTITYVVEDARTIECGEDKYLSIEEAVEAASGNTITVTVTANVTEEVALPQGKALTVKAAEGVEANVTVTPAEGAFVVSSAVDGGVKYESKKITVEMAQPQTAVAVTKIENGTESAVTEEAAISAAVGKMTGNQDVPRTDNTDKLDVLDKITVTPTKIVLAEDGSTVRSATFDVTPEFNAGQSLAEGQKLKFRLPVDSEATQLSSVVYHNGAQFGVYSVTTKNDEKYIEIESDAFSPYGYELLDGETANPVAAIGTTGYASLAAAVAAAPTDGTETTITMLAGETLSSSVTFPANTKIVLDLNGQTINNQTTGFAFASGTSPARFTFIVNGDLTVKDSGDGGNISIAKINQASPNSTKAFYVNGKLTVESGTISADYSAAYVNANAEMVVNGGVVHGDSYGININKSNGHVTINGGKVTAAGEATLCTNGNEGIENLGIFDINGGTIENTGANGTAIYNPNRGTVINVHAPATITGATAIVMKGGTINIDGGTVTGTGAFGEPGAVNSGFKPTGDALYVEDTYSTNNNNFKPTVNITGGTFTSANGYAAQYYTQAAKVTESQANGSINVSGTATLTSAKQADAVASTEIPNKVNVSGGSFTHAVPEEYCADGYIPATQDPETGLYTVKVGSYVAQIGATKYETLAEALANAANGDTVELLGDTAAASIPAGKNITLDLNGKTITGQIYVTANATLVVNATNGGVIDNSANAESYVAYAINAAGNLTINGGTFKGGANAAAVSVGGDSSTVTVNDGTFSGLYGLYVGEKVSSVRINDGTFTGSAAVEVATPSGATADGGVQIDIYGGSFTRTDSSYEVIGFNLNSSSSMLGTPKVTLYGGTYNKFQKRSSLATGYQQLNNGNGTWTVKESLTEEEKALAVAKVGDYYFFTSADANDAGGLQKGETIELVRDSSDFALTLPDGATLEGNGYTLTGVTYISVGKSGTIQNVKFKEATGTTNHPIIGAGGTLVVTGCEFDSCRAGNNTIEYLGEGDGSVTITGNVFKHSNPNSTPKRYINVYGRSGADVNFTATIKDNIIENANEGGTTIVPIRLKNFGATETLDIGGNYIEDPTAIAINDSTALSAFNFAVYESLDGNGKIDTNSSVMYKASGDATKTISKVSYVAQIVGGEKYETLAEALANAANGDTVTMLDNVTLTEPLNVTLGDKAVTLDLGGKTLAGRTNLKSGSLTIKNGTVAGGSAQALNVYGSADSTAENYSVLTIASDVNVTADVYGVCMFGATAGSNGYGAVVNIAGNVTTTGDGKNGAVFVSGNLGKNVSGDAHNVINVTGKITSATDAAIAMNGLATVNVSDGAEVTGNTAIAVKRGVLNVTGGTIRATGEKNYDAAAYANGTEMTGAAISVSDTYSQYGAMTVNVSGGTVKSDNADALFKKDGDYKADATIAVSAGSFSSAVPEEFCAAGYIPGEKDPDTGLYTVVTGTYVAQIVRGGSVVKKYTTLSGAIGASEIGDTVQLLANVTENLTVNKAITIDGQTFALTGDGNSTVLTVDGGVTVEVKNIVIDGAALFNYLDGTVKVTGYSTLALGEGVSIKNGIYCNLYLDRGSVTGSQGVTMVGGEAVVNAEGKAMYGEKDITVAVQALSSMLNGGSSLEPGTTIGLPYFDIVRQRPDGDIVNIADGKGRVKQGASLLFLANGDFSDAGQETVTLPTRFYSYTLNIANFVGATGWTEGEWNDIIDTGCATIDLIAGTGQGDKPMSETVDVTLRLNEDVAIPGEDGFEYRNSNFTIDGNNKAISGTIVYTDNAGTMENVVMGTEEEPLVLDMTGLSAGNSINLGSGIAATNVTIKVTETQAATQGTTIVTWNAGEDGEEEAASLAAGVTVAIVDATTGEPEKDEQGNEKTASLMWDAERGVGYIGPCEARLTTVDANSETVYIYTSLAHAIELARNSGDTVTLMMDIENFTGTQDVNKSLVLDGAGHTIKADASASSIGAMFNVRGDEVVIKNMTIDGDHKYWYCVQAFNGTCTLQNMTILDGAQRMGDENNPQVGYGAAVHVNGADLRVSGEFNAIGGGKTAGVFPFTAILYSNGTVFFADGAEADIGEDLLLVGMGPLNIDTFMSTYAIEENLAAMNIPGAYIPYTLALDGTNSGMGFVGASPQPWNTIIDYGKEIMEVATEIGFGGFDMEPDTTPVEVGLLTDTELPDTFTYEDSNFTVNGNGNALSGTIKYTDEAGIIENIVLGTEEKPLVLDLREVTDPVEIGNLIGVTNVTVLMTAEQATLGQPVFTWNVETAGEPDNAESVKITVLESAEVPYDPEEEAVEKGLVWDDELGIAYIGPCEARLTGPEREPGYMDLTNAFNMAVGGDTVTLFWSDVTLNEEIGLPAGTLLFATNKYELALGQDAAFVFTNATSVFRSEMAFSTDIIALAGDVASGYLLRTATDGTTNVYSVVQRGEYNVTGKTEAGTDGTAVIKVSDEWIVANMGKTSIAEIKTINEVEEYLDSRDSTTGMRKWENYVLKQTENPFRVSGIAANGALSTTLSDTPEATATTGFTVQYALNEVEANGTVKTAGTKSDGHNFSVAVDSVASNALYKVRAYLTSGNSTLVVDSTNTLGVLKAQPTIARSIIAVPWKSLRTGGDITVADYIRAADLAYDDKLHVYNGDHYDTWTYRDGNWSAVKTFIAGKEGTDTKDSGSAETTTLARGTGVWLERASGTAANLYLIGEYTPEPVETPITAGSASAMSWNLVGSPSVEAIDLNAAFGAPANAADRIVVPAANGLQRNYTYKNGKWGYSDARKLDNGRVQTFHNTNAVLRAGTGFWYLNAGNAQTIQW